MSTVNRYRPRKRNFLDKLKKRVQGKRQQVRDSARNRADKVSRRPRRTWRSYLTFGNALNCLLFIVYVQIFAWLYVFTASVYVEAFAALSPESQTYVVDLGSQAIKGWPLIGPVLSLPFLFLERFINSFETSTMGLLGFTVYLILQSLELIPTVIWESPALILFLIEQSRRMTVKKIPVNTREDSDYEIRLKDRHNNYYVGLVEMLNDLKSTAYMIDITICFLLVKFVYVGFHPDGSSKLGRFFEGVSQIDFGFHKFAPLETLKVLSSLFLLLILTKIGMRIFNAFTFFARRPSESPAKNADV